MPEAVYVLCFLTSAAAAFLLLRAYQRSRAKVLFWCALGFIGLCVNNLVLSVDVIIVPDIDLSMWRNIPAIVGMAVLVFGLIWET
jgi:hypothetical protein